MSFKIITGLVTKSYKMPMELESSKNALVNVSSKMWIIDRFICISEDTIPADTDVFKTS